MTESFPRQEARTRRFSLGVPRAFRVSPDGARVVFLRTQGGADPVTCLWVLDVDHGAERLVADPRTLGADERDLPPQERARRERVRESAGGIVAYATDRAVTVAVFALSGQVFAVPLTGGADGYPAPVARPVATRTPALDPRPDPAGRRLAYVCDGALRVASLAGGDGTGDRAVADPAGADGVTFGLPEFIAAEEMDRQRGYWWAPDGSALLVARVDETPVARWHIADPAHPDRVPAEVAYPAAGTPNAAVSLLLARLDGGTVPVDADWAAFPYLVSAVWQDGHDPLVVVQSRDQRTMRILGVDVASGTATVLHEDTDPVWLEIVPGVPAWTADGRIVWTRDEADTRRLVLLAPGGAPEPVTPPGLQVRGVLDVDGDAVLFQASGPDPASVDLLRYQPSVPHLRRIGSDSGVQAGTSAGGTTVSTRRALDADGVTVTVSRDGSWPPAGIPSLADRPSLPAPDPVLFQAGPREIQTAVLFPSWYRPGQDQSGRGPLPVLLDPYGGPHAQRVLRARGAYLVSQWFAEQGFAVVVADGRGTPGRGPAWERAVAGDLAGPVLEDQVDALAAAAERFADLDPGRVAIRGWSFGGFLAALAVLRRPDVFHAAIAGAPVTDWRLYDTHYTERYLGLPGSDAQAYDRSGLIDLAERAVARATPRPLMLIHGLADDNVVVAHTLRLSAALLAAGYPHEVLPLTGITHMASQETVAENLLLLQLDFLRRALGM
ncbi:MAG TPA: prolyl oligopeptidase family serine peptidase [Streptosporangiaceae bacterium]|nr:prolyl oligopeptidase family serine peptidase [Streptosporangiaceae bacterium]